MNVVHAPLPGVLIVEVARFRDDRGWFAEMWNEGRYRAVGISIGVVQDNVSFSERGVLRGLHYQAPGEQAKLISVLLGAVYDVVVDIRPGSPTFAQWYGHELSADNGHQLFAPEGFAHGFLVLSDVALVQYSCSAVYEREYDHAIVWDDPDIGIVWPEPPRLVSAKDRAAPRLRDVSAHDLPQSILTSR